MYEALYESRIRTARVKTGDISLDKHVRKVLTQRWYARRLGVDFARQEGTGRPELSVGVNQLRVRSW